MIPSQTSYSPQTDVEDRLMHVHTARGLLSVGSVECRTINGCVREPLKWKACDFAKAAPIIGPSRPHLLVHKRVRSTRGPLLQVGEDQQVRKIG